MSFSYKQKIILMLTKDKKEETRYYPGLLFLRYLTSKSND